MRRRLPLRALGKATAVASLAAAVACAPVSNGPEPTLYMPPIEQQKDPVDFDAAIPLMMAVDLTALRRPPLDEIVDAQITAMTDYVRRHGRGLDAAVPKARESRKDDADAQLQRLFLAASRLSSYLPAGASPDALMRTSVDALARSLGDDAEVVQGDPFAVAGAAEVSAGVFEGIAVLRLRHLENAMSDRVTDVFNQWSTATEPPRALILDLSECVSGGPRAATTLVNALAPGRPVLWVRYRDMKSQTIERQIWAGDAGWGGTRFAKLPVFVLVSNRTSSAAEAVVQALRAHRSVHVIGHRTAGSGRILNWSRLPWSGWFGFTIADLHGVDGEPLRGKPVIPDTCTDSSGLVALPERTPDAYGKLCVEGPPPALEDVLDHVGRLLAAGAS